ncbi:MAG: tRNA (guanosine(37)-N1)-methyltransferase TrmD [Bacilli bacterium]
MRIDILTLFPDMLNGFFEHSIIKRAIDKGLVDIYIHDFREYAKNKHHKVDDTPYGGGAGMLLMVQPIVDCLRSIPSYEKATKIITSAGGTVFHQTKATQLSICDHLIFICGHYEGFDERILEYIDEEISIGDFIMTGGEMASLAMIDAIIRLLPEAIRKESIEEESFTMVGLEYPQYTKPAIFEGKAVPPVLISGHHEDIRRYRLVESLKKTYTRRPEMLEGKSLTEEEKQLLQKIKQGTFL